ncbi:DEAD/DEAH box helicase [Streptomyces marispadix]|uniref:AAA domain-containing protein n=1 Tax=Streptomyces marispadix TaxID=2922868 RepID=A0ABS9T3Z3_9ACTN|nr:AAA domain-containing protein [Streptomyces marispadix]MCH6163240.1 AAA domain-containing protein [Streptomyces marispadix]
MPLRTVRLPGPVTLVPGKPLHSRMQSLIRDHPGMPQGVPQLAADLNSRADGVPTTFDEPRDGGDWSLLLHGRTYVVRLFLTRRQDAYTIASVNPLRIRDHHRIAQGSLLLRPAGWHPVHEHRQIPPGSQSYWPLLVHEWEQLGAESARERGTPPVTGPQAAFLDTVDGVVDATQRITSEAAKSTRPFPYRSVASTSGQRYGTRAVYEFELAGRRRPEEGSFVQIKGEPGQRGQVTRVSGPSATVRFDEPVDWRNISQQGELEVTFSDVVYAKQREAVALLRSQQSHSPALLPALVDHRVRALRPASEKPTVELDDDQLDAFRKALAVEDMLLVLGPPGTGKTRTISQIAGVVATRGAQGPVLVTSHTNRAVDNVLPRLPRELCVLRVGNDGKVTEEGRPFLLERQAADLREEILRSTGPRRNAYAHVDVAARWAQELDDRLERLGALLGDESRARAAHAEARRSAGGSAQVRVDGLLAERERVDRALDSRGKRIARLTRIHDGAEQRTAVRGIGVLLGLVVRWCARRMAAARAEVETLRETESRVRGELLMAEEELDTVTRDVPAVRAARGAVEQAERLSGECRADALTAAHACRAAIPAHEAPPPVGDSAGPDAADGELARLRTWMAERLPLLAARGRLLTDWHRDVSGEAEQLYPELIRYAHVIAATAIGTASRPELAGVDFDLAIVDEAGQIGVADALVPLVRARRAVLVGDHQQLPPFLDSEVESWGKSVADPSVIGLLTRSLLEMLVNALPGTHIVPLTVQRRMPKVIADFASTMFYEGNLHTDVEREHQDPLFRSPLAFVDTARLPERAGWERSGRADEKWGQRGYTNPAEAALLTRLAFRYHRSGAEWAVIVPYRAQAAEISAELVRLTGEPKTVGLNVGTVDSFQGGERDVILYGFTRSNPHGNVGFLKELRRANVAFTRARHQLVLVGDMDTLTSARDRGFRELAEALRDHLAKHGDIRQYREIFDVLTDGSADA